MKLHFGAKTGCCNDVRHVLNAAQVCVCVCVWLLEWELTCEYEAVSNVFQDFVWTNDVFVCSVDVCVLVILCKANSDLYQDGTIEEDRLVEVSLSFTEMCMHVYAIRLACMSVTSMIQMIAPMCFSLQFICVCVLACTDPCTSHYKG